MVGTTINDTLKKGIVAHKAGKIQEAGRCYTAILEVQPKHPDANYNLGVIAVRVGKILQALPLFKRALEANPSVAQFWLSYIDALIKLGKARDAMSILSQAKARGCKGIAFDQIEKQLNELNLKNAKEPTEATLQPIIDLYSQGQFQEVLEQSSYLLRQFPDSVHLYSIKGTALRAMGDFDAAIGSHRNALKINPDYAEAYNNMGNALKDMGDLDAAIDSYKHALKINPDYTEAYNNMGVALKAQGDFERAIDSYKQALKINPDYVEAYNNMGVVLKAKGDFEGAINSYKQALRLKPEYAQGYSNMGIALKGKGDFEGAINSYKQALKLRPDYAEAYIQLVNLKAHDGHFSDALDILNEAHRFSPKNQEVLICFSDFVSCVRSDYPLTKSSLGRIHLDLASLWQHYKTDPLPDDDAVKAFVNHLLQILETNQVLSLPFKLSQIFRGNPDGLGNCPKCKALFETKSVIPEHCFGCYKVVLSFANLYDCLRYNFYMDKLDPEVPIRRKLMNDMRGGTDSILKGFYYTRDWEEANSVCNYLKQLMAKNMKYEFSVKVKRGCSEFQDEYPEYNTLDSDGKFVMTCSNEWKAIEAEFYARRNFSNFAPKIKYDDLGLTLADALAIRNWVVGRKKHGHDDFQFRWSKKK